MMEYVWSADEEYYDYDNVIELIQNYDLPVGATVSLGEKHLADVDELIDANDVIEMLSERAYDNFGECAEDFPNVSKDGKAELERLLAGWINKHCDNNFYWIRNVKSYTITEEDIKESGE